MRRLVPQRQRRDRAVEAAQLGAAEAADLVQSLDFDGGRDP
jgi:hypothetical protein